MINSFKNFDRLGYKLSKKIEEYVEKNANSSFGFREEITNTIFSTIFSAMVTDIALGKFVEEFSWYWILVAIFAFIALYILIYFLYRLVYRKISSVIEIRKARSNKESINGIKQIQQDFDNIACDSVLVAQDYKDSYIELDKKPEDKSLVERKIFCYFEIMHYLYTACDKTYYVVKNWENCVRNSEKANGVDTFRVKNMIEMMKDLRAFLDAQKEIIKKMADYQSSIEYQLGRFDSLIKDIDTEYQHIPK